MLERQIDLAVEVAEPLAGLPKELLGVAYRLAMSPTNERCLTSDGFSAAAPLSHRWWTPWIPLPSMPFGDTVRPSRFL